MKVTIYTVKKSIMSMEVDDNNKSCLRDISNDNVLAFYKLSDRHLMYPLSFSTKLVELDDVVQAIPVLLPHECLVYTHSSKGTFIFITTDLDMSISDFLLHHVWIPLKDQPEVMVARGGVCIDKWNTSINDVVKHSCVHLYFDY